MTDKQRIMIVDDDANIAELISLYLTKECFDTEIVPDGETAVERYGSYKPDLILLDIMLPGIDGYEVLRRIRKLGDCSVIMLSAKGETFDKVLGLELATLFYQSGTQIDITPPTICKGNVSFANNFAANICIPLNYEGEYFFAINIAIKED